MAIQVYTVAIAEQNPLRAVEPEQKRGWTTQDIAGRNIDIAKLTTMLRLTFGERFDICMMHNSYHVEAPRKLSQVNLCSSHDEGNLLT